MRHAITKGWAAVREVARLPSTVIITPRAVSPLRPHPRPAAAAPLCASSSARHFAVTAAAGLPRQVKVAHILLPAGQEALQEELSSRIAAGEDLARLAQEHSTCPSRAQGGEVGWIGQGRTVPEFEAAAFGAGRGEVVTCATQFGLHVIKVLEERQAAEVGMMTVQELGDVVAVGAAEGLPPPLQMVDVREAWEAEVASIPGFQLLPLSQWEEWGPQAGQLLDKDAETVVLCHAGVRSMRVAQMLVDSGFTNVRNIAGGIDAYSRGVDPGVPLY